MSDIHFKLMTLTFKIRDFFKPPANILKEANIGKGFSVLDYGCGPGGFSLAAAEMVGESGAVYALDIQSIAIEQVQKNASRKGLKNIKTIFSDCDTSLPDDSIDVVILYDVYHDLGNPSDVLKELYRVLKPDAALSFSDHHLNEDRIISEVTGKGLFKLSNKGRNTYTFAKIT